MSNATKTKNSKKNIAILGTATNVGKSTVATALCRILSNQGINVAPFKAQNMSNNSWVTKDGGEISRAQVVQARAARVEPTVDMNPVLLKPMTDTASQVVIQGHAIGNAEAKDYFNQSNANNLFAVVEQSLNRLQQQHDLIVLEGAGSCAEINLYDVDITNCRAACAADADILLVADIEKCGVFAQIIGTLELMPAVARRRVKGIIINKFRGDPKLFDSGVALIEQKTNIPVLGVVPYFKHIKIDEEDAISANSIVNPKHNMMQDKVNIAIIYLPHISNVSDFSPLEKEPGVELHYLSQPRSLLNYDLVILPGSKSVMFDLQWLRDYGWEKHINNYHLNGGELGGICGGLQMLGQEIFDPHHVESEVAQISGLGYFDYSTTFAEQKTLKQSSGVSSITGDLVRGYEIHAGVTPLIGQQPFIYDVADGVFAEDKHIWCTYLHGLFDGQEFRQNFLRRFAIFNLAAVQDSDPYDELAKHFLCYVEFAAVVVGSYA